MPFTKSGLFVPGSLPAADADWFNRVESALADATAIAYAEDMTECNTTGTGSFGDPTTGTVGPLVTVTVPTGGRFVDFEAECEAHHSADNTNGIWFVLMFSKDLAAFNQYPSSGYQNNLAYQDTTAQPLAVGASMWFADSVYRPLRLGQARTPAGDGTTAFLFPSATKLYLAAGSWRIKMGYGIKSGGSGTAYFRTRRLRAQVLPNA